MVLFHFRFVADLFVSVYEKTSIQLVLPRVFRVCTLDLTAAYDSYEGMNDAYIQDCGNHDH